MKDSILFNETVTSGQSLCDTSLEEFQESSTSSKTTNPTQNSDNNKPKSKFKKRKKNGSVESEDKVNVNVETTKINAFQLMMNSRQKSIGRNSPGRDVSLNASVDTSLDKKELKERKSRLENWAELKGAAKRKREYDEIGNCIEYKLEKRGKKLKKMLQIQCQSDDEVITKRKKRRAIIESDGEESSNEAVEVRENKNKNVENGLTRNSVKRWKCKIKLSMDQTSVSENQVEINGEKVLLSENDKLSHGVESEDFASNIVNSTDCEIVASNNANSTKSENDLNSSDVIVVTEPEEDDNKRVLRTRRAKPKVYDDYFMSDDEEEEKDKKKKIKVAPVFLKAVPKPKIDPEVAEARRQFLLSGVPSVLRKEMEKQQKYVDSIEEFEFEVFPTISHVHQKSPDNIFWDLPKIELKLSNSLENDKIEIEHSFKTLLKLEDQAHKETVIPEKVKNCKKVIKEIKSQNPNYPVYKMFNSLYSIKNGTKMDTKQGTPKRRGRPRKNPPKEETVSLTPVKTEDNTHTLWTEKYKAKLSSDIIGNRKGISSLKNWLTNWLSTKNSKNKCTDSESDFDNTDSDSRDSTKSFGNTVILKGPTGSGKTAAVYAICNELGFDVLEVNASSKRTGKRLLQELQEATQSHQVRKKEVFFSSVKEKKEKNETSKKCVLLVEDIDIVFEQDEGFTAALSQIIATTKRPIVLTTTDEPSSAIQKTINYYQTIKFFPLSSILSVWLQILCVVEGYYVDLKSLEELLSYYRGDIRRTLLQLQFWLNSGGQLTKSETIIESQIDNNSRLDIEDDSSNLPLEDANDIVQIHYDCVGSKQIVENYNSFSLPRCNNLGVIWWNLPNILNLPNYASLRLGGIENSCDNTEKCSEDKLDSLVECYDSMIFADVMCGKSQYCDSLERRWRVKERDSLVLEENMSCYEDRDFRDDLIQTVLSGRIKIFKDKFEGSKSKINITVPVASERRWRSKQYSSEEKLEAALLQSDLLDRRSRVLDYMPCLRAIARSEFERASQNTKRGNRFYNYLRNLGVHVEDSTYKSVCDVFRIWE